MPEHKRWGKKEVNEVLYIRTGLGPAIDDITMVRAQAVIPTGLNGVVSIRNQYIYVAIPQ